ncbi:MAG: PhoU domain-containing protein [Thermoplasmatota archaeon]
MELRRIQVTGGSTHVISLPKKWVDRNKLGRSDTLAIHEEPDGSLLMAPYGELRTERRSRRITIDQDTPADSIVRRLVGAYLAGADEIQVHVQGGRFTPELRQTLRTIKRDLVGVEILEESQDTAILQDLMGVSEMDLRKAVTRMHRIAQIMFNDAWQAFETRDGALATDVTDRDDEVDRLEWMVSKQMHALLEQPRLAAQLNIRPGEALNLYLVGRAIERMADHASKVCKNTLVLNGGALPNEVVRSVLDQAAVVKEVWDEAFSALKRVDFDMASAAVDAGKAAAGWRAQFPAQLNGLEVKQVEALTLIADSLDRTRSYAIDIAETAMNHTFQMQ